MRQPQQQCVEAVLREKRLVMMRQEAAARYSMPTGVHGTSQLHGNESGLFSGSSQQQQSAISSRV